MVYYFAEVLDCPDIILKKGQVLIMDYSIDGRPKQRTYRRIMPLDMHLKDLIKMREKALQWFHAQSQLPDPLPKLFNICVRIERAEPTIA